MIVVAMVTIVVMIAGLQLVSILSPDYRCHGQNYLASNPRKMVL